MTPRGSTFTKNFFLNGTLISVMQIQYKVLKYPINLGQKMSSTFVRTTSRFYVIYDNTSNRICFAFPKVVDSDLS